MRWASFIPTPGAFVIVLASPVAMHSESFCGSSSDRIEMAAFGPTPETDVSALKHSSSSFVTKPNRSIAS